MLLVFVLVWLYFGLKPQTTFLTPFKPIFGFWNQQLIAENWSTSLLKTEEKKKKNMFGVDLSFFCRAGKGRINRGSLDRKHGNKNFYKGTGARSVGHTTSKGKFRVDPEKIMQYQVPDLNNFEVIE